MASDTAYLPSSPPPPTVPIENHRKRRRNRTRVSCLNCYASKRKCDRKRPCTRCIKHGLTGLCFYELDDPTARDDCEGDETTHLRRRIAELESVVRAMNNRPHPRWTAPGGVTHREPPSRRTRPRRARGSSADVDAFFDAEADEADIKVKVESDMLPPEFTPSDSEGGSPAPIPVVDASPFGSPLTPLDSDLFTVGDEPYGEAGPSVSTDRSPASTSSEDGPPRPQLYNEPSYTSAATQTSPAPSPPPCDCLAAATLHSPLVYFASALRASREALEGSHASGSACVLLHRITELDEQIFSATPPDPQPALEFPGDQPLGFCTPSPAPRTPSPPVPSLPPLQLSTYPHSDSFAFLDVPMCPSLWDWT